MNRVAAAVGSAGPAAAGSNGQHVSFCGNNWSTPGGREYVGHGHTDETHHTVRVSQPGDSFVINRQYWPSARQPEPFAPLDHADARPEILARRCKSVASAWRDPRSWTVER